MLVGKVRKRGSMWWPVCNYIPDKKLLNLHSVLHSATDHFPNLVSMGPQKRK